MSQSQHPRRGEDVEDDFVSPLTMIRGVLEMLREIDDMQMSTTQRFIDLALDDCDRLAESIDRLIDGNPEAVKHLRPGTKTVEDLAAATAAMDDRLTLLADDRIAEVDFSDLAFTDDAMVNRIHDALDARIAATGQQWYLMVNFRNCTIEPGAWVAFAHRGNQTNKQHSLGTVRYAVPVDAKTSMKDTAGTDDGAMFRSRQAAMDYLRKERASAR